MTAVPMTATETADYAALLERAHALLPFLREHAPQAEKLRQLPAEVVKALPMRGCFASCSRGTSAATHCRQ